MAQASDEVTYYPAVPLVVLPAKAAGKPYRTHANFLDDSPFPVASNELTITGMDKGVRALQGSTVQPLEPYFVGTPQGPKDKVSEREIEPVVVPTRAFRTLNELHSRLRFLEFLLEVYDKYTYPAQSEPGHGADAEREMSAEMAMGDASGIAMGDAAGAAERERDIVMQEIDDTTHRIEALRTEIDRTREDMMYPLAFNADNDVRPTALRGTKLFYLIVELDAGSAGERRIWRVDDLYLDKYSAEWMLNRQSMTLGYSRKTLSKIKMLPPQVRDGPAARDGEGSTPLVPIWFRKKLYRYTGVVHRAQKKGPFVLRGAFEEVVPPAGPPQGEYVAFEIVVVYPPPKEASKKLEEPRLFWRTPEGQLVEVLLFVATDLTRDGVATIARGVNSVDVAERNMLLHENSILARKQAIRTVLDAERESATFATFVSSPELIERFFAQRLLFGQDLAMLAPAPASAAPAPASQASQVMRYFAGLGERIRREYVRDMLHRHPDLARQRPFAANFVVEDGVVTGVRPDRIKELFTEELPPDMGAVHALRTLTEASVIQHTFVDGPWQLLEDRRVRRIAARLVAQTSKEAHAIVAPQGPAVGLGTMTNNVHELFRADTPYLLEGNTQTILVTFAAVGRRYAKVARSSQIQILAQTAHERATLMDVVRLGPSVLTKRTDAEEGAILVDPGDRFVGSVLFFDMAKHAALFREPYGVETALDEEALATLKRERTQYNPTDRNSEGARWFVAKRISEVEFIGAEVTLREITQRYGAEPNRRELNDLLEMSGAQTWRDRGKSPN